MADFSTYEGRQAYRDANPGTIVDASGAYNPSTGQTVSASSGGGGGAGAAGGGGVAAPAATVQSGAQQLGAGINSLLGAIASGNKQAFDEAVRQFNATFGLDTQKFQESVRQYNEGLAVTQAGLTGQYQGAQTQQAQLQAFNEAAKVADLTGYFNPPGAPGAPGAAGTSPLASYAPGTVVRTGANQFGVVGPGGTLDTNPNNPAIYQAIQAGTGIATVPDAAFTAGQQAVATPGATGQGTPTMAYQEQTYRQQLDAINAAAALQANPFRQQQVIGQLGRVLGGQGVAGFSAPNTVAGVGTAGGTGPNTGMAYMSQLIDDIRGGTNSTNSVGVQDVLNAVPTPAKINSVEFLRSAPSTQNMILQAQQERYGLDPQDSLAQIKNTMPQAAFQSPTTFGQIKG